MEQLEVGNIVKVERSTDVYLANYWERRNWQVIISHENGLVLQGRRLDNTGLISERHMIGNNALRYMRIIKI